MSGKNPDVKIRLTVENGQAKAAINDARKDFDKLFADLTSSSKGAVSGIDALGQQVNVVKTSLNDLQKVNPGDLFSKMGNDAGRAVAGLQRLATSAGQAKISMAEISASKAAPALQAVGKEAVKAAADTSALEAQLASLSATMNQVKTFAGGFLAFSALKSTTMDLIDTQKQVQQINFTLQAAAGSQAGAAKELEFVAGLSDRLGVSLGQTAQAYAGFAVSAKTANLTTTESHDIFRAASEAITVFHLDTQRAGRAMYALEQIMGAGVVRTQDLKLQLDQAIPGAYENFRDLVKAANKDDPTFNFQEQLEKGLLDVKKYAPQIAGALRGTFKQEDVAAASEGINASIGRLETSLFRLKSALSGGIFEEAAAKGIGELGKLLNTIAESGKDIAPFVSTIGLGGAALVGFGMAANKAYEATAKAVAGLGAELGVTLEARTAKVALTEATLNSAKAAAAEAEVKAASLAVTRQEAAASLTLVLEKQKMAAEEVRGLQARRGLMTSTVGLTKAEERLAAIEIERLAAQKALNIAVREGAAANLAATASSQAVAAASAEAAVASTAMSKGVSLAATAGGLLSKVGKGLFALIGGWPAVFLAAGAGIYYLATATTELEDKTESLTEALEKLKAAQGADIEGAISSAKSQTDAVEKEYADASKRLAELRAKRADILKDGRPIGIDSNIELSDVTREIVAEEKRLKIALDRVQQTKIEANQKQQILDLDRQQLETMGKTGETYTKLNEQTAALAKIEKSNRKVTGNKTDIDELVEERQLQVREAQIKAENAITVLRQRAADDILKLKDQMTGLNEQDDLYIRNKVQIEGITKGLAASIAKESKLVADLTERYDARIASEKLHEELMKKKEAAAKVRAAAEKRRAEDAARLAKLQKDAEGLEGSITDKNAEAEGVPDEVRELNAALATLEQKRSEVNARVQEGQRLAKGEAEAIAIVNQRIDEAIEATIKLAAAKKKAKEEEVKKKQKEARDDINEFMGEARDTRTDPLAKAFAAEVKQLEELQKKAKETGKGLSSMEYQRFLDEITEKHKKLARETKQSESALSQFAIQAQRNIQTFAGEGLSKIMDSGSTAELVEKNREDIERKLEEERRTLEAVLSLKGLQSGDAEFLKQVKAAGLEKGTEEYKKRVDEMTKAFSPLMAKFKQIGASFAEMVQKMAAELAAAKLIELIGMLASAGMGYLMNSGPNINKSPHISGKYVPNNRINPNGYASGGHVSGPGTATSDSIAARLSNGEYVIRAAAVDRYGKGFFDNINGLRQAPRAGRRNFASGGMVDASGGGTQVNVINNSGQEATQERRKGSDGTEIIDIIIGRVAGDIRKGGAVGQAVSQTFGVSRKGSNRG